MHTNVKNQIVTFGEILQRLSKPGCLRFPQGVSYDSIFGGSEANAAVSLAIFGNDVQFVTRLPKNGVAKACCMELQKYNVKTDNIVYGGDRLGIYYLEQAAAMRNSSVVYDRNDSSFTTLTTGMIDWNKALANAKMFHWSGIACAMSLSAADATFEAVREASSQGVTISCDINFRKNLWKYGKKAEEILHPILGYSDIMFGTEQEFEIATGVKPVGFKAQSADEEIDAEAYKAWGEKVQKAYPRCKVFVLALRNQITTNHHLLTGLIYQEGKLYTTRIYDIEPVVDPMGVGDAFIAAYLHAQYRYPDDAQHCLEFALAASALKNTIPGDFNLISEEEVENLRGGSANGRIQR